MSEIDITFAVLCYNQQKQIVQTLYSLKNQVEKYGKNSTFQLIICDDGSKDKTTEVADRWLRENGEVFDEVTRAYSKINRGTAKNITNSYRLTKGKHYIVIAGDDLLADVDVVEQLLKCDEKKIIRCLSMKFCNKKIVSDYIAMSDSLSVTYYSRRYLTGYGRINNVFPNGSIFSLDLMNEEMLEFIENFTVLEDGARTHKLVQDGLDVQIEFVDLPIILYRISENQVMNTVSKYHQLYLRDKKKLTEASVNGEVSLVLRYYLWCGRCKIDHPRQYKFFVRWIDFVGNWKYIIWLMNVVRISKRYRKINSSDFIEKQNRYILKIEEMSEKFYEK